MPSKSSLAALALCALLLALLIAGTGIFTIGRRVGKYESLRSITRMEEGGSEEEQLMAPATMKSAVLGDEEKFGTRGEVILFEDGAVTIQEKSGSTQKVVLNSSTKIRMRGKIASPEDIDTGDTVFAIGRPAGPGTIDATAVRILGKTDVGGEFEAAEMYE